MMTGNQRKTLVLLVALAAGSAVPASGAERKHGAGIGLAAGSYASDLAGGERVDFEGFSVFGKYGITEHWGILATYRDLDLDAKVPGSNGASHELLSVHAVLTCCEEWNFRPHVKFGIALSEFVSRPVGSPPLSDSKIGPAIGLGFEWGSPRYAFFFDVEWMKREIQLVAGVKDDTALGSTSGGLIFKF